MSLLRRTLTAAAALAVLTMAGLVMHYGPLLYRESKGDPWPYFAAMARLTLTGADLVEVGGDETLLMQRCCREPFLGPLNARLAAEGWRFVDQMGAGLVYEKAGNRRIATSRMFSRLFVLFRL